MRRLYHLVLTLRERSVHSGNAAEHRGERGIDARLDLIRVRLDPVETSTCSIVELALQPVGGLCQLLDQLS